MKIGLVLPLGEGDFAGGTATYADLRQVAQAAESGGLDSVWVYDHLLFNGRKTR